MANFTAVNVLKKKEINWQQQQKAWKSTEGN